MIFIGCDPGLIHPAMCVMEDDKVDAYLIEAAPKTVPFWTRADLIALMMVEKASHRPRFYHSRIALGIESAAFVPHSRSMEQMACCRQAIYSHFSAEVRIDLLTVYEINPLQAKRAVSTGKATKQQIVEVVKVMYPHLFDGRKVMTSRGKVTEEAAAIADSIAITMATRVKWKEEKLCGG